MHAGCIPDVMAGGLHNADGAVLHPLHVGELVIDGGTLSYILGTDLEQKLAQVDLYVYLRFSKPLLGPLHAKLGRDCS